MKQKLIEFQQDLRNGLTVEEACTKYNIPFNYVFKNMERINKRQGPNDPQLKYITKRSGHFSVRKTVKGKQIVFGTYSTLEEAIKIREYCEKHGWIKSNIDEYCKILGIERCSNLFGRQGRYH